MRPVILRVHIYTPQGKGRHSLAAAVAHSTYMRSPRKEELVQRDESDRDRGLDEAQIHARYMAERPGSEGLFGPTGQVLDGPAIDRELATHQGPVWRLVVSVHEDDVRAMGGALLRRPAWEDAARAAIPRMAEEMGIPLDQLRWSAAMHRKEGHPHIHVLLWSADPSKGFLNKQGLDQSRRAWAHELYAPERDRLGREKSALRAEITSQSKILLGRTDAQELGQQLAAIAESLPGHGRLAYSYMPAEVKQQLDQVADWLLRQPELAVQAKRFGDVAAELATHYITDPARHEAAREKAMQDIRQRMAGGVLRAAVGYDERLAWQQIGTEIWRATRARGDADPALTGAVREAVSRVATVRGDRETAIAEEARALLAGPLQLQAQGLLERAARRGPDEGRDGRVQRAQDRLERLVARRLERSAEYVADARADQASHIAGGLARAVYATVRQAERDALLAAAREAEDEAARKRAAAAQVERW